MSESSRSGVLRTVLLLGGIVLMLGSSVLFTCFVWWTGGFRQAALTVALIWLVLAVPLWLLRRMTWRGLLGSAGYAVAWLLVGAAVYAMNLRPIERASVAICARSGPLAVPALRHALSEPAYGRGAVVLAEVDRQGWSDADILAILRGWLKKRKRSMSDEEKRLCLDRLEKMGPAAAPALPELVAWLRSSNQAIVGSSNFDGSIARVLGAIGPDAVEVVPIVERIMYESSKWALTSDDRMALAGALYRIDPQTAGGAALLLMAHSLEQNQVPRAVVIQLLTVTGPGREIVRPTLQRLIDRALVPEPDEIERGIIDGAMIRRRQENLRLGIAAARVLWQWDRRPEEVLPMLKRRVDWTSISTASDPSAIGDALDLIEAMGPAAATFIPWLESGKTSAIVYRDRFTATLDKVRGGR